MEYLIPNLTSDISLAQSSLPEPMMCCPDEHCTYPFGPACDSCIQMLEEREEKRQQRRNTSNNFIEDPNSLRPNESIAERLFFDGTAKKVEKQKEDLVTDDGNDAHLSSHRSDSETRTVIPYPIPHRTETSGYPGTDRISTTQISFNTTETSVSQTLDPWLSTLFDHTLAGHLSGDHFVGGAEEENLTEDTCPLCFNLIGDPRDQHLLRCKYAHEEREREERMAWLIVRDRELRGRR